MFGDLTVSGNNTVLVQNRVQGAFEITGTTDTCTDNAAFAFAYDNDDGVIDAAEVGDDLSCGSSFKPEVLPMCRERLIEPTGLMVVDTADEYSIGRT